MYVCKCLAFVKPLLHSRSMENISSPATMDRTTKIRTGVLLVILFGVCLLLAFQKALYPMIGLFAFNIILCTFVRGHLPDRYILEDGNLVIDAPLKKIYVPLRSITQIRWIEPEDKRGLYRQWASGGLFGDWGYFSSATIPTMKVYARRTNQWILITTYDCGRFVISPDDPDFFYYLNRAAKGR